MFKSIKYVIITGVVLALLIAADHYLVKKNPDVLNLSMSMLGEKFKELVPEGGDAISNLFDQFAKKVEAKEIDPDDVEQIAANILNLRNQNATLTIYALEPNPGSGDTSVTTITGASVGHAFISITQGNNTNLYGYYPVSNWINPWNTTGTSVLGNDSNNPFSSSITTTISGSQLQQIINASINFNSTYNLNTYNCTDFAIEMGNLGGLNLPECNGTWRNGNGSNPGTLGIEIRNRSNQQGQTTNTNGGNSPVTHKGC